MKKKILFLILVLFSFSVTAVEAISNKEFKFNIQDAFKNPLATTINKTIDNKYRIDYKSKTSNEEKEIERLSRKVVYLFVGNENTEFTVENYMYRKQTLQDMCYDPEIPKDENGDYDFNSQEATDSFIMSYFVGTLFKNISHLNTTYKKVGQPIVIKEKDKYYATIAIKDFEYDDYNDENPMKIIRSTTDVIFYLEFKMDKKEWKLSYANALFSENTEKYFEDFSEQEQSNSYHMDMNFDDVSAMFDFTKLNKVNDVKFKKLYNDNKKNSIILNSFYRNNIVNTANGFYLRKGVIATTWNFVKKSLQDSQYISITDSNNKNHLLDGIVYINEDLDLAILKQKDESGVTPRFASDKSLKAEDPIFTISSKQGYNLKLSSGLYISTINEIIKKVLTLTNNDQGSALYNINGEIIGMNTNQIINNNFSSAISIDLIENIRKDLNKQQFKDIKSISFDILKEKYFYKGTNTETIKNNIKEKVWKKYKQVGNIEKNINLELVKASYKNKIVSLRYKNNISNYISSMSLAKRYKEELLKEGYKEKLASTNKYIYENKDYKVIITDEFDYLIIIIMEI